MKKGFKKQLMTGLAAIALVAPLVLGGINGNHDVHAAGAPQLLASANNQNTNSQNNSQAQLTSAAQSNGHSARQNTQDNKPTKTITQQQLKQMLAKQAAMQRKQLAKELKGSMDIFVAQGDEVYTAKAKGTKLFPTTMKKYMSVKKFKKIMVSKVNRLRYDALRYRATRNKRYLQNFQKNVKYARVGRIPTQKQMAKIQQQQAAKAKKQKKSKSSNNTRNRAKKPSHRRSNKKAVRRHRRNQVTRKSHRKVRRTRRNKKSRRNRSAMHSRINGRIKRSRHQTRRNRKKQARSATTFVKNNQIYLKSEFKRGTWKKAKRSQFANGPVLDNVKTLFDRYRPNDRRAVIPEHYRIIPNDTTWLVGHHTNNVNKINHIKDAYYYNKQYRGWSNIGYNN